MTTSIFAQIPPLETGVSQDLARWRSANYSDIRYKLNITLEKGAPLMKGTIEVSVKLSEEGAKNDLVLDWRTTQFENDKDKPFAEVEKVNEQFVKDTVPNGVFDYHILKEHILVSKKYLKTGENTLLIKFASPIKTSGAAITRYIDKEDGAEYIYSLFVPSDASTAFPVFDQPDLKARFQLNVFAPKEWNIISNTVGEENIYLKEQGIGFNGAKNYVAEQVISFEETKPISTYVFAFAAGDFRIFIDEQSMKSFNKNATTEFRLFVRKSQLKKVDAIAKEVFRLNREGVKFLENYFDYKFPFPKYDLVLIPEFPFGGMEHAGATFLKESSVIFPTEPTKNDYVSRANVIFHEAAHQWFGDTVTMKWFDDLWLKEGFAEFMAYKTLEKVMPEYNAWKIFYERNKQAAYLTDSTKGTTPIYQEIKNLSAAKSAYGNIVYRKAPSFLKQAEFYLGEDMFREAVRSFLKKYQFKNSEWKDLVDEFADVEWRSHSAELLGNSKYEEYKQSSYTKTREWAETWVKQRGLPIIKVCIDDKDNCGKRKVTPISNTEFQFGQRNPLGEESEWKAIFKFLIKFDEKTQPISFIYKDGLVVPIDKISLKFRNKNDSSKLIEPIFVFPNYQDYGYGIFLLDEKSRAYVLANIQTEKDDFLRAMMWGSLWDSVRETELAPAEYVELVIKNINVETDESTIQTLLGRVGTAMNYYIPDDNTKSVSPASAGGSTRQNQNAKLAPSADADGTDKAALAAKLEKLLIEKFQTASTVGQKITYFRALQSIGSNDETRKIFKDLLNNKSNLKDVSLKTKDKFDLVTRLLILDDKDAPQILANLEKTETSDEAKRYAYAAKAGIRTAENKQKFWTDFVSNKEISESWIEAAFVPFNSIRHSELTLPFLDKALAELPTLKKNRKIFFVNGWLAAFINGQKSEEALKIVNEFLEKNPSLDRDLRLKILENADNLERAVKIRAKFGK